MTEVPTLGMLWALCVTETPGAGPLLMAGGFIFCLEGGEECFLFANVQGKVLGK